MKTLSAVLWAPGESWDVTEINLDDPSEHEVLIRYEAAGLCYSDEHLRSGELESRYPIVGGHEGAGVIEALGPRVTRVKLGQHVVCSFAPSCGQCYWCLKGIRNLCPVNSDDGTGKRPGGRFVRRARGKDIGAFDVLGAFSRYGVIAENACIPIPADVPFDVAAIASCAVPTGWGAATRVARVEVGDTVVIQGTGGVGLSSVQGAALASATHIVAVDTASHKRDLATRCGATFFTTSIEDARQHVMSVTDGRGADVSIVAVGAVTQDIVHSAFSIIRRHGTVVLVGVGSPATNTIQLPGFGLTVDEKRIIGTLYGSVNPAVDIPILIGLYRKGKLALDELVTARYSLGEINEACENLRKGKHAGRGVIVHSS